MSECTCDLADVSRDPWHPEYVRAAPNGCAIHDTDEGRRAKKERDDWRAEVERRHQGAMRAAREAP